MEIGARNTITVDLEAVRANVRRLKACLQPRVRLATVVKADGYGHGGYEVGQAAKQAGADCLAVGTADEAVELRDRGYSGALLTMGPLFTSAEMLEMAARGVEVTVGTERVLETLSRIPSLDQPLAVHLKVETGMNRQGLTIADFPRALNVVESRPHLRLAGVMTHLACADSDPDCVAEQLEAFRALLSRLGGRRPRLTAHAANSAATLLHPDAHLDLVRCGVAVYGLSPFQTDAAAHGLSRALSWTSTVASVKEIEPGQAVGYGHTYRAHERLKLALVPIGYADGVRRDRGNRGSVLIGGRRYPMVGRVSMDYFTVDLGPKTRVKPGDSVTLIGADGPERITAEEIAHELGTINYEVTCLISSRRGKRVFTGSGTASADSPCS